MSLRKGKLLVFKDRTEIIQKASNNPYKGMVTTDKNEYSTCFVLSWINFGFVKLKNKEKL